MIAHQLRPFAWRSSRWPARWRPATAKLKVAIPSLSSSIKVLNTLFNTLAYQHGSEPSYLYWGSWLAHNADSLVASQDANGALTQGIFMGTCSELNFFENTLAAQQRRAGRVLDLLNAPKAASAPGDQANRGTFTTCPS